MNQIAALKEEFEVFLELKKLPRLDQAQVSERLSTAIRIRASGITAAELAIDLPSKTARNGQDVRSQATKQNAMLGGFHLWLE